MKRLFSLGNKRLSDLIAKTSFYLFVAISITGMVACGSNGSDDYEEGGGGSSSSGGSGYQNNQSSLQTKIIGTWVLQCVRHTNSSSSSGIASKAFYRWEIGTELTFKSDGTYTDTSRGGNYRWSTSPNDQINLKLDGDGYRFEEQRSISTYSGEAMVTYFDEATNDTWIFCWVKKMPGGNDPDNNGGNGGNGGNDEENRDGIPKDPSTPTPSVPDPNIPIPNPNVQTTIDSWGNYVVTLTLTGIQDPNTRDWLNLYGTGLTTQNVWIEVDGSPKGILVVNLVDNSTRMKNDIVFTIDNSGSMGEEADAIARDIISWAQMLTRNNLDVKFGVVGYGGYVDGAIDITDAAQLQSYLNTSTGTGRTSHFGGNNGYYLKGNANGWSKTGNDVSENECGALAIKFADEYFDWRSGSNRIYVNFTDEPNQPYWNYNYSVEWFKSQNNWPTSKGTVHTVYSSDPNFTESTDMIEKPWKISEYTGGTTMFIKPDASNLNLNTLTVSDAMIHSYTIKFIIPASLMDGFSHTIRIVIYANNGTARGVLSFKTIFGRK